MAVSLPYLVSYRNLPTLFDKIGSAKVPEKFNREFLHNTLGLKASNDRAMIPLLRNLGFIDQSGTPTSSYGFLKSGEKRGAAIAAGVRKAYQPLFDADQDANQLSGDKLKGLVAQIAGTDDDMTGRIAGTFGAITRLGDFKSETIAGFAVDKKENDKRAAEEVEDEIAPPAAESKRPSGLRTEFHYNIQVHLPPNASEENYLNIFNALRKTFQ